jgi:hypothetical protein
MVSSAVAVFMYGVFDLRCSVLGVVASRGRRQEQKLNSACIRHLCHKASISQGSSLLLSHGSDNRSQ